MCVCTLDNISVIGQAAPPALARGTVGRERERDGVLSHLLLGGIQEPRGGGEGEEIKVAAFEASFEDHRGRG